MSKGMQFKAGIKNLVSKRLAQIRFIELNTQIKCYTMNRVS
jgi:hypothetical protein